MPSKRLLKKQKAVIERLANETFSVPKISQAQSTASQNVIERVKKCFAKANHLNANEAEARAAMKMASKIMEQHNIQQSEIMAAEDESQREKRGGMSTVKIWPANSYGKALNQTWVNELVGAVKISFECKSFSTKFKKEIQWTFYGISEHTVSAATAFEAVHNQILDWTEQYTGVSQRNSYCLGVTDGLLTLAKQGRKAEEENARQLEARALAARIREEDMKRQAELRRLRQPSPGLMPVPEDNEFINVNDTSYREDDIYQGESDDISDPDNVSDNEVLPDFTETHDAPLRAIDTSADFDTELHRFIIPDTARASIKRTVAYDAQFPNENYTLHSTQKGDGATEIEETLEWKSVRQLTTYRKMSREIEESVLRANKIKLRKRRKLRRSVKDVRAFRKGQRDSRKIKMRAARIEQGRSTD